MNLFAPVEHNFTPELDLLQPASKCTRRDPGGPVSMPVPLAKPPLVCRANEWQRSDVSRGFYLDAQPEKAFTVWHCAAAVIQSACPSVIQKESRKGLNKTARRHSSRSVLFLST